MKSVCFLFIILVSESISEPHCSKFHYEEKLLEKMIRMEVFVEDMKREMAAIQKSVTEALAKLNEDTNNWTTEIAAIRQSGEIELAALQEKANSELEKNIELVESLKDKMSSPNIAFSARTARDNTPSAHAIIVFTETFLNLGEAYSTNTGIFTAPYGGTYMFNVQLCVDGIKRVDHGIVVNDVYVNVATYRDNDSRVQCHNSAVAVVLKSGDNVWVKVVNTSSGKILFDDNLYYWNTFSRILVHAD